MINTGEFTLIDGKTYRCLRVEDGYVYLVDIVKEKGRPKKVKLEECPYFKDGKLFVPEKKVRVIPKVKNNISIRAIAKQATDLQLSRTAIAFLAEWVETAISNAITNAEQNAKERGQSRISAAHIHWLETNERVEGYWIENENYIKD
jgi:histone H3/H4